MVAQTISFIFKIIVSFGIPLVLLVGLFALGYYLYLEFYYLKRLKKIASAKDFIISDDQ